MQTEVIQPGTGPLPQLDAQEYLDSLQTLALELGRAMDAVVARELPTFEDSIVRQRATCARLEEIPRRAAARRDPGTSPCDAELSGRIVDAAHTLSNLNKRYSALLKHSGDTMRLFAGLFQSYSGPRPQAATARLQVNTWSCEL